ncbi:MULTISPECIES: hypothetical protein [Streptomycetaceae]|nr:MULTISPECIES: hypothetical protein [Streptomycetaceae]CCB76318.1 conserved protein of unknown function [Streptantibioticus cattleyicolor NRRL 8057 = DSM 46488]
MTDGRQQPQQPPGPEQGGEQQPVPKPGQPTLPFRAATPPPGYGYPQPQPQQPGYGYPQPQQPAQPGYPQTPRTGYGYPPEAHPGTPEQGRSAPAWTPPATPLADVGPTHPGEPDWSALAERAEAGDRRRKVLLYGGGALAAVVIGAVVATAVIVTGHKRPAPGPTLARPTTPAQPTPSFSDVTPPPPPNPLTIISSAKKDTAPLTPDGLFAGARLDFKGRAYTRTATDATDTCYTLTSGGLGDVLAHNGCRELLRATYTRDGVAVTVGVAVFDSGAAADRAKNDYQGYVQPLAGGGTPAFCHATACQTTANAVGRYAYFTIAGLTDGHPVTADDPQTKGAAADVAAFAFNRIVQRGRDQAATAPAG